VESLNLASRSERLLPEALLRRFDPRRLPRTPWVVIPEELTRDERPT
jgi:hypothetical protein